MQKAFLVFGFLALILVNSTHAQSEAPKIVFPNYDEMNIAYAEFALRKADDIISGVSMISQGESHPFYLNRDDIVRDVYVTLLRVAWANQNQDYYLEYIPKDFDSELEEQLMLHAEKVVSQIERGLQTRGSLGKLFLPFGRAFAKMKIKEWKDTLPLFISFNLNHMERLKRFKTIRVVFAIYMPGKGGFVSTVKESDEEPYVVVKLPYNALRNPDENVLHEAQQEFLEEYKSRFFDFLFGK